MSWSASISGDKITVFHNGIKNTEYTLIQNVHCTKCAAPIQPIFCTNCTSFQWINRIYAMGLYLGSPYHEQLTGHILDLKEKGKRALPLSTAIYEVINVRHQELLDVDGLVPVPAHPSKKVRKGFNQAALLANALGSFMNVPVYDCLSQVKEYSQVNADGRNSRYENTEDAFEFISSYEQHIDQKHLLIIDDVSTSGATAQECAKTLISDGAKIVDAFVAGRAWKR